MFPEHRPQLIDERGVAFDLVDTALLSGPVRGATQ